MQIGLECFMDEQISSMIASENRHENVKFKAKRNALFMIQMKIII